jgi:hypothetical protein
MVDENKPVPPADLSLKYMAWDIKTIGKNLTDQVAVLRSIDLALKDIATVFKKHDGKGTIKNEIPF